jgi:hypothetical protein
MNNHSTMAGTAPGGSQDQGSVGQGGVGKMASKAGEKLMDTAEHQKQAGADFVTGMAGAVRRAAGEFEQQLPEAADYIRYAADQMETVSDSIRRRDVGQMVADVQSFARRQPTAFLGLSFLAGFAAIRLLRSGSSGGNGSFRSGADRYDEQEDSGRYGAPQTDDQHGHARTPGMSSGMNPAGRAL